MDTLKTAFVVNPQSGGKRKNRLRERTLREIAARFPGAPVDATRSGEEAAAVVRARLEEGFECIGVMGGDGTLNNALGGFFRDLEGTPVRKDAVLAVIPAGTGGDFRRTIGLEDDPVAALSLLTGTSSRPCDAGIVEFRDFEGATRRRYFLNITSFGVSGLVDKYVMESKKKLGGTLTFFGATVKALVRYRNVPIEIVVDGGAGRVLKSTVVAVANGRFFGSGMEIAPKADIADGLFELVAIGDLSLVDFIRNSRKLYGGKILAHPEVFHGPARAVKLTPVREGDVAYMDMDGEPCGTLPATLTIVPGALRIKT